MGTKWNMVSAVYREQIGQLKEKFILEFLLLLFALEKANYRNIKKFCSCYSAAAQTMAERNNNSLEFYLKEYN